MKLPVTCLFVCLASAISAAQGKVDPSINGYVTRVAAPDDFDVNGIRVKCNERTKIKELNSKAAYKGCLRTAPYLGQHIKVTGDRGQSAYSVIAWEVKEQEAEEEDVHGFAVIEAEPDSSKTAIGVLALRADGYQIQIDGRTKRAFQPPLNSLKDVTAGDWIDYKGRRRKDGSVIASSVTVKPDLLAETVGRLRKKYEFDPDSVTESDKQSGLSKALRGVDPKRFPALHNALLQARLSAIGERLIPAYQRALADSEPTKIHFRFQLADNGVEHGAISLASGIISVSPKVLERLQDDSQLAAVLAQGMACILELDKGDIQKVRLFEAANLASTAAQFLAPISVGLGVGIPLTVAENKIAMEYEHQITRVALVLMNDAGFDIYQAPVAWWLLCGKNFEPTRDIQIPDRSIYMYRLLGENWLRRAVESAKP